MTPGRFRTRSAPFRVEILSLPYSFFCFCCHGSSPYLVVYQVYCTNILGTGQAVRTFFLFVLGEERGGRRAATGGEGGLLACAVPRGEKAAS